MSYSWRDRGAFLMARLLLSLLAHTWRIREEIPDDCRAILAGSEIAVVAFWHGKMLPAWYRFRRSGMAALVSASRDGEILARYLERSLGYARVIRGSSSRKGSEALDEMVDALKERSCLITPDGPRGPAGKAKPGALVAAIRSGRPLLAVGWHSSGSWRLNSWDAMEVPRPFAEVVFRYCKIDISPPLEQESSHQREDRIEAARSVDDGVGVDGSGPDRTAIDANGDTSAEDAPATDTKDTDRVSTDAGSAGPVARRSSSRREKLWVREEDLAAFEKTLNDLSGS
jgi:lysophospholipid acyltransferase (LPLAT)-like uncharacterized protein